MKNNKLGIMTKKLRIQKVLKELYKLFIYQPDAVLFVLNSQ